MSGLNQKIIAITGGTRGLGWAITTRLAVAGATVYCCGLSEGGLAEAARQRAGLAAAERIHLGQCDVSQQAAYEAWLDQIYHQHGRLDVLIHNAAFIRWVDLIDMPTTDAIRSMEVGYHALVYGTKKVLPWFLAQNSGHFINIGSITGNIFAGSASAAYSATKAAIDGFSQTLHTELYQTPIQVTLMRLGAIQDTNFFGEHVAAERMPRVADMVPLLTPEGVAEAVLKTIKAPRPIVTLPYIYRWLHIIFALTPHFSQWLGRLGGTSQRHYA
ncbi:MAG TPA: SDR family oxidoreductase [Anaerolineae bacterium]|nr:SDR family oxidoreductase [Anaerolineae bacterium]